ncbi:ParA family protein [Streptomyces sp. NPDC127197]|uniref:ParA family protein n=1 Tax=Streptomyces sp. NPDC127197 TaxID=3345388 RepID=UPI0036383D48
MGHLPRRPRRPPAARVFIIGFVKGGTAKSTSAFFIALYWALLGYKVLAIDADPKSQMLRQWAKKARERGYTMPFKVEVLDVDLRDHVKEALEDYDVVVVDTGGGDPALLHDGATIADVVLMPFAPSEGEVWRIPGTWTTVATGAEQNPNGVVAAFFMVRADHRTRLPRKWREEVENDKDENGDPKYPLLQAEINQGVFYIEAIGHVPAEVGDYDDLMKEVIEELKAA